MPPAYLAMYPTGGQSWYVCGLPGSTASWGYPGAGGHSPAHTAHSPAGTIPADSLHCARGFAPGNRTPQGRSLLIVVGTCRQHLETYCCHRAGRGTMGLGTMLAEPAMLWLLVPC